MKNKKIIAWVVVIIGIFSILWLIGKNKSSTIVESDSSGISAHKALENVDGAKNQLTTEEKFYDFGTISMKNGLASKIFKVSNSGTKDINLEKLTTSCMCTTAYIIGDNGNRSRPFGMPGHGGAIPKANEIIKAGETRSIEVVYDPNAHGPAGVGLIDRFVYLEDSNGKKITFEIKAIVTP